MKKLHLSRKDKKLYGVIGGLAEYFDTDSTILRVGWILVVVFTGFFPGVLAYILMALVIPREPS